MSERYIVKQINNGPEIVTQVDGRSFRQIGVDARQAEERRNWKPAVNIKKEREGTRYNYRRTGLSVDEVMDKFFVKKLD